MEEINKINNRKNSKQMSLTESILFIDIQTGCMNLQSSIDYLGLMDFKYCCIDAF